MGCNSRRKGWTWVLVRSSACDSMLAVILCCTIFFPLPAVRMMSPFSCSLCDVDPHTRINIAIAFSLSDIMESVHRIDLKLLPVAFKIGQSARAGRAKSGLPPTESVQKAAPKREVQDHSQEWVCKYKTQATLSQWPYPLRHTSTPVALTRGKLTRYCLNWR